MLSQAEDSLTDCRELRSLMSVVQYPEEEEAAEVKGELQKSAVSLESLLNGKLCGWGSVSQPGVTTLFTGVAYQIACTSDIYITIHNSSKITVM